MRTQTQIENEFWRRLEKVKQGDMSSRQAFGNIQEWELALGHYRLLLMPFYHEWWYYDNLHESWESTDIRVGEATFTVFGRTIGAVKKTEKSDETASAAAPPAHCTKCGVINPPGSRFCNHCGDLLNGE